jgi:PAS domain S-box-containing protein
VSLGTLHLDDIFEKGSQMALPGNLRGVKRIKKVEELRKSEALLAKAELIGNLGSWEHDLLTGQDTWSANLCRILGVDPTTTKLSEELFWEIVHPDDRDAVRAVIEWGMKGGQEYEYQARFILPGGRVRTFYTRGRAILGPNNKVIKRVGVTQDITVRVEGERALLESEERYRDLVENSHDLICTHDLAGRILSMNELPARLLGYRPEELIGRYIHDHLYKDDTGQFAEYLEQIRRDGFASGLMVLLTKSGERRIWKYQNTLRTEGVSAPLVRGMAHDVTEQIKAQKALRESTARLQALVNSIDQVAFEFDVAGTFLDIWTTNEMFLFRPRKELLGRRISDVTSKALTSSYLEAFRRVLETGNGEDLEYSIPAASGDRWFLGRLTPIAAPDGGYKSICMLARDITERKQTEKSLTLFRTLLDRSNDAIEVVDPITLRFLDVNQKACSDLGYSREEMLRMTVFDIDPSVDRATHADRTELLNQLGSFIKESIHRRKDGSTFPVELNMNLVHLDKNYAVCVARDITDRKRAEVALQQERDRAQRYLDIADVILLALDLEGRVILINRKGCSILGWKESELLGRDWVKTCVPERLRDRIELLFEHLLAGDFPYVENVVITRSGQERLIGWRNSLLLDDQGCVIGTLSSGEDITERKVAECAVRQLSGHLLTAQDDERRILARELHDGIGTYVTGLSLALGKIRTFLDESDPEQCEVITGCREFIQAAGREIRTISYLLHPPTLEPLGLESALGWLLRGFSDRSGIKVTLDAPADLGRLRPEIELMLFRVAQEALNNVYRHSESKTVRVRLFRKSLNLVLEIADSGIGMNSQFLESTPTTTVGISGMRERVKNLGGTLTIKSAKNKGCVVRATIVAEEKPPLGIGFSSQRFAN